MPALYWITGPAVGGGQMMSLTIVGEVGSLQITTSASSGSQVIPVPDFKPCIAYETLQIGPIPLSFLPLTANGTGCGAAPGQMPPMVPAATSASPTDPTGPSPFCDALTHGGTVDTTQQGGGGNVPPPQSPKELCDAAQMSPALSFARHLFDDACADLRADQANVTAYAGIAAAAAAAAAAFIAAAIAAEFWVAQLVLAAIAGIFGGIALAFSILSGMAASNVSADENFMDRAQKAWESAVAAVRTACCPAWITINTNDLVCP